MNLRSLANHFLKPILSWNPRLLLSVFFFTPHFIDTSAFAQEIDPKILRWGGDAKSGLPFVFRDPKEPETLKGFEKEILDEVAKRIGRKAVFVQNEWESLIPGLSRNSYDVVANGMEITPEREEQVLFSEIYYSTFESIIVRKDETRVERFSDLKGNRVGTLKSSLAHQILEKQGGSILKFYESESNGFDDVRNGRLDAFFVDYPIALYYALNHPELKQVGEPIGDVRYAIAISKHNSALHAQINQALIAMKEDGALADILSHWNLLHPRVVEQLNLVVKPDTQNSQSELTRANETQQKILSFQDRMRRYASLTPLLLRGAALSLGISLASMAVAMAVGLILALSRVYGNSLLKKSSLFFIEAFRGTPLLIQLYLIFFGLPHLGIHLEPFWAAVMGLGLNYGAYEAENYRNGIEAIPYAQTEAAIALSLNPFQRLRYVVLPQASTVILPPMTNDFISLIKDSSLVSVITMVELTTTYSQLATTYFDHLGLGILVALLYFLMGYPFVRIARKLEHNLKKSRRK